MWFKQLKELPWWAIGLSLFINTLMLVTAVLAVLLFKEEIPIIVFTFLFFYIFIAQPLKDWMIARMGMETRYTTQTGFAAFNNRLTKLTRLSDVLSFLSWLVKTWRLSRVRLLVFDDESFVYFIKPNGRVRKMRLKDKLPGEFRVELTKGAGVRPVSSLSTPLRAYMHSRKVKLVAPILFRERLVALLGFGTSLERTRLPMVDHAAHRIGLALENERLERTVPRSEFLNQEFKLAEKIERHLSGPMTRKIEGYTIQKLETAWEKKHFSAIFGLSRATITQDNLYFLMLLRMSVAATRSNALQLFATQGYFFSLAKGETQLSTLAQSLHTTLRENENKAIVLDGFLLALNTTKASLEMLAFGSHLAYRTYEGWVWTDASAPLGSDEFDSTKIIQLEHPRELILSMREYPLLLINGEL